MSPKELAGIFLKILESICLSLRKDIGLRCHLSFQMSSAQAWTGNACDRSHTHPHVSYGKHMWCISCLKS